MRKAMILAMLLAASWPVQAAEEKKEGDAKKGGLPGTNVDMPFLMAPLTDTDGKLTGYAYISSRLTALSDVFALTVREKLPFILDVMVRDVNGAGVATADDPQRVDVPGLEARLLADARKVIGSSKVKLISICTVQIAPLHPVQTQALSAPPGGMAVDEHQNPVKSRCES